MKGTIPIIGCSLLVTPLLTVLGFLLIHHWTHPRPEESPPPPPSPAPFTDLETAIAARGWSPHWKVHQPPDIPGPYRLLPGTVTVGTSPLYHATISHPDATGKPVAPIELRGNPEFAQMAIHLETADGRITGAILKR